MPKNPRFESAMRCQTHVSLHHKPKTWSIAISQDFRGDDDTIPTLLFRGCSWRVLEEVVKWMAEYAMPTICTGLKMYREADCEPLNGMSDHYLCLEIRGAQSVDVIRDIIEHRIQQRIKATIDRLGIDDFLNDCATKEQLKRLKTNNNQNKNKKK